MHLLDITYATDSAPPAPSTQPEHTSAYQILDLHAPNKLSRATPLMIFIHGGAWRSNKPSEFADLATRFAESHNIGVAVVGYRMSTLITGSQETVAPLVHPVHARDVGAGVAWILSHFLEDGADQECTEYLEVTLNEKSAADKAVEVLKAWNPSNIFVVGHSCGAHTGSFLLIEPSFIHEPLEARLGHTLRHDTWLPRFKGYAGIEGIYDIPLLVRTYPAYKEWFIVAAFGHETDGGWSVGSATTHTPRIVGTQPYHLIVHSTGDELVDVGQAKAWYDALRDAKVEGVEYVVDKMHSKHDDVLKDPVFFVTVSEWIQRLSR
ncbi:Alpha/Beta hydrolase protein [Chytriomyces sp. MP71]|nr:Alpha/Beta hydrolase protein [Chytriomyces sp. MP71]